MNRRKHAHTSAQLSEVLTAQASLAVMVVAAAAPLLLLRLVVPTSLVLPTVCLVALAAAGGAALIAWWQDARFRSNQLTLWDVAGAMAFIGFAAGILAEPQQVIDLIEQKPITQ